MLKVNGEDEVVRDQTPAAPDTRSGMGRGEATWNRMGRGEATWACLVVFRAFLVCGCPSSLRLRVKVESGEMREKRRRERRTTRRRMGRRRCVCKWQTRAERTW